MKLGNSATTDPLTYLTAKGGGKINHFVIDLQWPAVTDFGLPSHQPQSLGHAVEGDQLAIAILHVDHHLHACFVALVCPLYQEVAFEGKELNFVCLVDTF